jgi:CHASE3 domain sensor protein
MGFLKQRFSALPLEKIIAAALAFGLSLAVMLSVGGYFTFAHLRESSAWATHTHEVLLAIANIESDLVHAETGQRGYLLTGKKNYLRPYEIARDNRNRAPWSRQK